MDLLRGILYKIQREKRKEEMKLKMTPQSARTAGRKKKAGDDGSAELLGGEGSGDAYRLFLICLVSGGLEETMKKEDRWG